MAAQRNGRLGLLTATPPTAAATDSSTAVTDDVLLEPFHYLCAHPGKNFRSQLIEAFNHWLHVPQDKLDIIKDAIEMLHTSSLLCVRWRSWGRAAGPSR